MKYLSWQFAGALRNDSHFELSSVSKNQIGKCYIPSQQDMGPTRAPYGIYMGPTWAPHMGLGWDLQHGSMWYPHGQTHMGHKWEPYGS